jgi:hypothetical protein
MDGINEFNRLHCSSEWHIEKCCPKPASSIYSIAFRVARTSGRFTVSYPNLATYFHTSERTIRRAIHSLREIELFKMLSSEPGHPCAYQPIPHSIWQQTHPGQCSEKLTMPDWEKDLLGLALFTQCDGRVKFFYPNVLKGMRNTGLSDLQIVERMKRFREIDAPPAGQPWTRGFVGRFMNHLKSEK